LQFGGALAFDNSDQFVSFPFPAVLKIPLFFVAIPGVELYDCLFESR